MDEETKTQTPVSLEGDMTGLDPGVDFLCDIRRRGRGRTIVGGDRGGCRTTPPHFSDRNAPQSLVHKSHTIPARKPLEIPASPN